MSRFILRRLLWVLMTVVVVATIAFLLAFLLPADPARAIVGPKATPAQVEMVRDRLGLDDPVFVQYARYVADVAQLDFGFSYVYDRPVAEILRERIGWTLLLAGAALAVGIFLGFTVGLIAAARAGGMLDRFVLAWTVLQVSLPGFWVGLVLLYLFGFQYPIFPLGGNDLPEGLVLPALALGLPSAAWYARVVRDTSLDLLTSDFVLALRAKGMVPRAILFKHLLRSAMGPIMTMSSADFGYLIGGTVLIETIFSWPGLGRAAYEATVAGDVPLIIAVMIVVSVFVLVLNLVVDVLRTIVDPRVRID